MNTKEVITKINPYVGNYKLISLQNLQEALQSSKGAKIVSLTTITVPDLKVNKDLWCEFNYELVKISYINGVVNFNYTNAVNNQRNREGKSEDFIAQKRKWGTRLDNSPFVSHIVKGEHRLYLEIKVEKSIAYLYFNPLTNEVIDEEKVKPFLREKKSSSDDQGVENEIILRDYNVVNIVTITIDNQGYFISDNME